MLQLLIEHPFGHNTAHVFLQLVFFDLLLSGGFSEFFKHQLIVERVFVLTIAELDKHEENHGLEHQNEQACPHIQNVIYRPLSVPLQTKLLMIILVAVY